MPSSLALAAVSVKSNTCIEQHSDNYITFQIIQLSDQPLVPSSLTLAAVSVRSSTNTACIKQHPGNYENVVVVELFSFHIIQRVQNVNPCIK